MPTLPEHLRSPPVFSGVRGTRSLVLFVCFVDPCLSFCPFSLIIVLSAILRYADSDYPFGIFKLFLIPNNKAPEFTRIFSGDQFLWYIQHPPQNHSSCIYPPPSSKAESTPPPIQPLSRIMIYYTCICLI